VIRLKFDGERVRRDVEAVSVRVPAFVEQRDGDAARPRADIADERGRFPVAQKFERRLHEQLGFGARDEHRRGDFKIEAVKLLSPRDVLHGLARRPAAHAFAKERVGVRLKFVFGMRDEEGVVARERV
jgi:hypothetical protein